MIPEKLILEGVYSYRKRAEIDFSILCTADLFGIFGNVGSGKSSILEAITYALYGKIERLSTKVYYNMMNLSSDKMFIDFYFEQNKQHYKFTFEAKRTKKDFKQIETPSRGGYVLKNNEWISLFDKDSSVSADKIIGLSYENFRRTIIVPQGKFQEFLHLEKSKRTEMLMDLFQLNRFNLYSKTASIFNETTRKTASVNGAIGALPEVNNEILEDLKSNIAAIEKEMSKLNASKDESDTRLQEFQSLSTIFADFKAALTEYEKIKTEIPKIEERKNNLNRYEKCRELFDKALNIHNIISENYQTASLEL
ncbi:MAG: SMC family ATPase, partial [Spirochaetales bacterium]|nr:SMC family ATPase [Spirochaetales bacterium]